MLGSKIWREIYFSKKMSNISEHFMKLYNYKIIYNCSHMQKLPNWIKNPDKKWLDKINKYNSSDKCIELLYDLKDGNLSQIIDKLDQKTIYSLVVQLLYAIYQMNKRGFYHCDIHSKNVHENPIISWTRLRVRLRTKFADLYRIL